MPAVRLVNPHRLRRRRANRRTNAKKRSRRRRMPAGLKRYWAKVRRTLSSARKGNPMAKRRRRRRVARSSHRRRRNGLFTRRRRRSNPVMYTRRRSNRRRHNPLLSVPMSELVPLTAWAVAGMAGTRIIPQMAAPQYNTGLGGYGLNFVTAVGLSWLGGKFAGARASQGLLVGGMVGLAARILSDTLGGSSELGGALSGDLDFDLGFYIQNSFPLPTTGSGPFLLQPGVNSRPTVSGVASMPPVQSAASAAANAAGQPSAAQLAAATHAGGHDTPRAWASPWAA
jgi:hypothetical protein